MTTRTPPPVNVPVVPVTTGPLDRAPAPVDVPVVPVTTGPLDRAPAPVSPAIDPELPRISVPVLRPATVAPAPAPTPYSSTATPAVVLPIEEDPVELIPASESEDRNIVPDTPRYVTVLEDGTIIVDQAAQLNFSGSGVSITAQGSTANIVITSSGNSTPGGSNTQIQFNDAGAFGGDSDLTYNKNTNTLAINGTLTALDATVYGAVSSVTLGASGNIVGGNLNTSGVVSATGNVRGSNINTAGIVSATGNVIGNYFIGNGSQLTGIVAGAGNALINGGNSFALQSDGNVVFRGSVPGQGVNRGMVWDFGANANGVNSEVRQDVSGLTVRAWTENSGNYAASVNIVTNQDANAKTWIFDGEGDLILPGNMILASGNIRSNVITPAFNSGITSINSGNANVIITIADEIFEGEFSGQVTISGVNPPVQANGDWWYQAIDFNQFQLYTDANLTTPVDGTDWPGYVDGGTAVGIGTYSNLTIQGGNISITSDNQTWIFDTTGNLTIPNDIVSTRTIDIDNRLSGNTADIRLYSADDIVLQGRDRSAGSGTEGGDINIYAGDSAEDSDASGGDIQIFAGDGGAANVDFGGGGGFITIRAGQGGSAIGDGVSRAESGGSLTLEAGDAGGNNGNIDRGADGGDVYINAGESTGNLAAGGDIVLTTGPGGSNAPAGNVRIIIPSSDVGAGGTWTFGHNGNLTLPNNGNIDGADGQFARFQSIQDGVVRSGMILNPGDGLTRLESWDNETSQSFTSADWSSATYVTGGSGGQIAFVNAPNILNFVNSIEVSRLFLQVNGGTFMPYQGYGSDGNNITFEVLTPPTSSPETVTSFVMAYSTRSRIEMDYDEGELNIQARDLDLNISGDQDVDITSSYRIRIENSSNVNGINISTDIANTFRTWTFNVDGSLSLPSGANIANGALNGGTASASVALNAFSPSGDTVSVQAQGNTSSAVISIFSNAGPVTSNWTFTTAPLDPSESFLYIPNGGAITTPNATGGEGGKNIFIQAGSSDPVTWNSNPGGELMLKGGYGSFGDGGGGPGGDVNIEGGLSSDSHAGNVNIASGLNTWVFDYTGNLTVPGDINAVLSSPAPSINGFNSINSVAISASGNITGGNLTVGSGIITGGNINGAIFNGNVAFGTGTVGGSGNITGGNISAIGNIVTGGQLQSSAFTGGNISWSANNQTDFQGAIKVGGTGVIKSPGGASSITLNNNGANIPILGVTNTSNSTSTTTGALIVSGGTGIAGNAYIGGLGNITGNLTVNGTGGVIVPNLPAFRVYGNGVTNVSTATNTTGVLNGNNWAADYNQGSHLNSTTGTFTAPVSGLYQVNLNARVANNTGSASQAAVYKNYGTANAIQVMWETAANCTVNHFGVGTVSKLTAGDTLNLVVTIGALTFDSNDSWSVAFLG